MLILSLDTSGSRGSIALLDDERLLGCQTLDTLQQHAQRLIPELQQLLKATGRALRELDLISVSLGPGSFTGVRVGVVCAKTLAFTVSCPLIGVDTLQAWAMNGLQRRNLLPRGRVWVIENAQRGDLFVGAYRFSDWTHCEPVQSVSLWTADRLLTEIDARDVVTGPGLPLVVDRIPAAQIWSATDPAEAAASDATCQPLAVDVARIGVREYLRRGADDVRQLEPRYLRLSAAEEKWLAKQPASPAGPGG